MARLRASRIVRDGDQMYPAVLFEPDPARPLAPGACTYCLGAGSVAEAIHSDRFDEIVKCPLCGGTGKKAGK